MNLSQVTKDEEIVITGWDGRSNPIYAYRADLALPAHERRAVPVRAVLSQYPDALYWTPSFERVLLRDWATDVAAQPTDTAAKGGQP